MALCKCLIFQFEIECASYYIASFKINVIKVKKHILNGFQSVKLKYRRVIAVLQILCICVSVCMAEYTYHMYSAHFRFRCRQSAVLCTHT